MTFVPVHFHLGNSKKFDEQNWDTYVPLLLTTYDRFSSNKVGAEDIKPDDDPELLLEKLPECFLQLYRRWLTFMIVRRHDGIKKWFAEETDNFFKMYDPSNNMFQP